MAILLSRAQQKRKKNDKLYRHQHRIARDSPERQKQLDAWTLDEETDPDGKIAKGLEVALSGDMADEEVADNFQTKNFPNGWDKWDALGEWVQRLV